MNRVNTRRTLKIVVVLGVVLLGLAATGYLRPRQKISSTLLTAPVKRGDVEAEVGATGTVEPREVVDVGAQVEGQINAFGTDVNGKPVDFGSVVDKGTVLAKIDDSLYAADVDQSRANLHLADAEVLQAQAKLGEARENWERAQKLGPSEALAPSAYDQYKATFEIARANLVAARATVAQARSALNRAERILGYCTITSPVKGVIIDRRINIGQTVVASLNAPSLFLIAKDLKRIQVWVSVNEADIGKIHPGEAVTFTVDTFPGQVFHGQVDKVRLNAAMTQNVVTYTVEVNTDNANGKLLPYLTANVQFITGHRKNVLTVPNAALRWVPQADQIVPKFRQVSLATDSTNGSAQASPGPGASQRTIWIAQGDRVRPVNATTGLTDGTRTEVEGAGLSEGMPVVIGNRSSQSTGGGDAGPSPFAPPVHGHH